LEETQPLLEVRHRRIAVARVDVAVDLARERGLALGGRRVDVALREEERLRGLVVRGALLAAAHRERRGTQALGQGAAAHSTGPAYDVVGRPALSQPLTVRPPSASKSPSKPCSTLYDDAQPAAVAASAAATERPPERHRKRAVASVATPAASSCARKRGLGPSCVAHSTKRTGLSSLGESGTPTSSHSSTVRTSTRTVWGSIVSWSQASR